MKLNLACFRALHNLIGQSSVGGHSGIKIKSASVLRAATKAKYLKTNKTCLEKIHFEKKKNLFQSCWKLPEPVIRN